VAAVTCQGRFVPDKQADGSRSARARCHTKTVTRRRRERVRRDLPVPRKGRAR